jgi:hypothetical protein
MLSYELLFLALKQKAAPNQKLIFYINEFIYFYSRYFNFQRTYFVIKACELHF